MSKLEVDAIEPQSGTTITIGSSGDTVNLVGTLNSNGSPLPGDISSVVAGTGLSGGGTTGAVTLNIEAAQPTITSLGTITGFTSTGIDDNADATAITISSAENVGIGGAASSTQRLIVNGDGSNIIGGIEFRNAASGGSTASIGMASGTSNALSIAVNDAANMVFKNSGGTERMRITSAGLVGIGISSPSETLEVQSSATTKVKAKTTTSTAIGGFEAWNNSSAYMKIYSYGSSASGSDFGGVANANIALFEGQGVSNVVFSTWSNAGGSNPDFIFAPQRSQKVIIKSDGKVGIGTSAPTENLQVMDTAANKPQIRLETSDGGSKRLDLYVDGSVGTIASDQSSQSLAFRTSNSERMRLTNTGLGIGTTSPSQLLDVNGHIVGNSLNIPSNTSSPPSGVTIHKPANNTMAFRTNSSERMRLTDTGLGIGNTVPGDFNSQARNLVIGGGSGDTGMTIYSGSSSGDTGNIFFADGTSGSDQVRGGITYNHEDNSMNFRTNDGANRIYISSAGLVGIGTASPTHKLSVSGQVSMTGIESTYTQQSFISSNNSNSYTLQVRATSANPASQYITDVSFTAASPDNSAAKFFQMRDSTTARVNINSDGDIYNHDGTYGTISDERIKQNIVDASSQWNDIKNIRVRKYKKKHDVIQYGEENAPTEIGVISQELETVSPGLIKEDQADSSHAELHEDFTGDNPQNVKYVKYSILYMKSIKALQEAMERIETLEAKVTELENA